MDRPNIMTERQSSEKLMKWKRRKTSGDGRLIGLLGIKSTLCVLMFYFYDSVFIQYFMEGSVIFISWKHKCHDSIIKNSALI